MIPLALVLVGLAGPALAHGGAGAEDISAHSSVLLPLAVVAVIYAKGLFALRRARFGFAAPLRSAAFMMGLIVIGFALAGPLHAFAERSFSAHMVEHELLIVVAAPLLVIARPGGVLLWAFTRPQRQAIATGLRTTRVLRAWRACRGLQAATLLHGAVLWTWHVPTLFNQALRVEPLHWLQHGSFLLSGIWFWQAILASAGQKHSILAISDLFATTMHLGLLGALLALARHPLYAPLAARADALADQQLAGVIMWVPGCLLYAIVALLIGARMLCRASPIREPKDALGR
ncbi:MAG: Cytochrome c oxidase caa3-type, assembly factor CtaG-related protein [Hyphomicrobiales bacterium]|nr:Cytochrome c oxidase caa3-type, assembly factor CtaG-related protein [Hyphomicrobiales bacterium]